MAAEHTAPGVQNKGRQQGGGVLLGLPGFYRPTPEQLHFNIETRQPQKKIYIKKKKKKANSF